MALDSQDAYRGRAPRGKRLPLQLDYDSPRMLINIQAKSKILNDNVG